MHALPRTLAQMVKSPVLNEYGRLQPCTRKISKPVHGVTTTHKTNSLVQRDDNAPGYLISEPSSTKDERVEEAQPEQARFELLGFRARANEIVGEVGPCTC